MTRSPAPTLLAASRDPGGLALIAGHLTWTHCDLETRVAQAAARLLDLGVAAGDRIAVWAANSPAWVVAAHAVIRIGAILVPLSTRLTDVELAGPLEQLTPAWLFADAPRLKRAGAFGRALALEVLGEPVAGGLSAIDRVSPAVGAPSVPDEIDPARVCLLMLTSGTSGRPKAVQLTWANQVASAESWRVVLGLGPTDRWWLGLPLFHVGGLNTVFRCAQAGTAVVMAEGTFDAAAALATWRRHGVTLASCVPTMLRAMAGLTAPDAWPASLRAVLLGGAPIPVDLLEACPLALATYGLTEACSAATLVPPAASGALRATSGLPLPGLHVAVFDSERSPLPSGSEGEIALQGPTLTQGYWLDPAATAAAFHGSWFLTGDLGRLDAAGGLTVLARRDDLIVAGGENIYPAELEAVLRDHPEVLDAAVVARPDHHWGHVPAAFFVPRGETSIDFNAWLTPRLARFKHPRCFQALAALPLLANGKLDRAALRRAAAELPPPG